MAASICPSDALKENTTRIAERTRLMKSFIQLADFLKLLLDKRLKLYHEFIERRVSPPEE
jgi:hypothetical protein